MTTKIINDRLVQFIQEHKLLDNCQIGFMPKQRTSDHIYTLHTLIQKHVQQKKQGKIFGCFIDFQKAFDSVWHNGLFHCMDQMHYVWLLCFSLGYTDNFIQGYSWMEQLLR